MISERIYKLADILKVKVQRDTENCPNNQGASAGDDIYLGKFDDENIELVAFFHEVGHIKQREVIRKREYLLSTISSEGLAWELGLGIASEHGFIWDYNSNEMQWAREQLKTYRDNEDNWR